MRKHKDVFYPNAAFTFRNMLSSLENIGYNVILNVKWLIYIVDILWNYAHLLYYILPANIFLYILANFAQFFTIMLLVRNPREKHRLVPYLPAMVIYTGYYLRIVRTIAHTKEFFKRASYEDPWNPLKSSLKAKSLKI